jgi:hypothetical protein
LLSQSSIVLLGNFNPAIFHPEWLDRYKILPIQEIQWAEGEKPKITEVKDKDRKIVIEEVPPLIVKPDLADLLFPSVRITATQGKYQCLANRRENFQLVKEVTLKTFTILSYTPIHALGINFVGHWKFKKDSKEILRSLFAGQDMDFRKKVGDNYDIEGKIILQKENQRMSLTFEDSKKIPNGIHFYANYHSDTETHKTEQAIQLIDENYDKNLNDVIETVKRLIGEPEKTWTH